MSGELQRIGRLYEESGGDPTRCEICEKALDDSEPWQRGLDGAGAHLKCLDTVLIDDEEGRDGEG